MFWMLYLACEPENPQYSDFSSRDVVDTIEPSSDDTSDSAEEDTSDTEDTAEAETMDKVVTFRSPLINCDEMQKRTISFTRMFPGSLNVDGESQATFYAEVERTYLGDSSVNLSSSDDADDCVFSIKLPIPNTTDLQEVVLIEDGESNEIGVQWAFYYPTTFVHHSLACQTNEITESNTEKITCDSIYSMAQSPHEVNQTGEPQLVDGDFFDWGSDILPVYVEGSIQGAFGDLGFQLGWNLAQFESGEMILVEPLGSLDQLSNILIDNRDFLPRYEMNAKGSMFADSEFGGQISIDLLPVSWLNGDDSIVTGTSMYVQDSEVSWSFEMWGRPDSTQFFGLQFPTESIWYQQWHSEVDVAVFLPVVFSGEPTEYILGQPSLGDDISSEDTRLGAVCKDSLKLATVFMKEALRPSDLYWYQLQGKHPGWYSVYGTQGDPSTWQTIVENTDMSTPYTYTNLNVGLSCPLPTSWQ